MMSELFKKAERKRAKARIGICSPSGAGKTHGSLLFAKGLGERIAVICTENGSAELEAGKAGMPEFDIMIISAPYDPQKYITAMHTAEKAGYEVIIIDSLSHAWAGSGGLLDKQNIVAQGAGKNSYTAWREITPMHNALIDAILQSPCHIIATMRSKVEYAIEKDDKDKVTGIKKLGMAPVQREGMDYEFTIVLEVDQKTHLSTTSKDRTGLFVDKTFLITEESGKELKAWLESGKEEIKINRDNLLEELRQLCVTANKSIPDTAKIMDSANKMTDEKLAEQVDTIRKSLT